MEPDYQDDDVTVYAGDCLDVLRELPDASVDAVVTDPPYGIEFMGREWDRPAGQRISEFRSNDGYDRLERPTAGGVMHPTVKPVALMQWLVRLVVPRGATVLDPFLGSGTTAEACVIEGMRCVGIEREPSYLPLIRARLRKAITPTLGLDL